MSLELRKRIFQQLNELEIVDPHTHIDAHAPAARTLADILGYHYYTELAHSAGMPKQQIEPPESEPLDPRETVRRLAENLSPLENTVQYSWLIEMAQQLFGFSEDQVNQDNWQALYDAAEQAMSASDWESRVLEKSRLKAVFLTNDFDDRLDGFDTNRYVPCLRTDDLVFHFANGQVRQRISERTEVEVSDSKSMKQAIGKLFDYFKSHNAKACAISLPPDFVPTRVADAQADHAFAELAGHGEETTAESRTMASRYTFWLLAEYCNEFALPFDLMIGVNRGVYRDGVKQGQDLYDSRVSLIQYQELFNHFAQVTFPISVLASVTNQELTSYAWIFPNVVTNGHWWYSNTPTYIEHDASARLEAVPATKQIGYYSDMYKLEFALPKFAMYKRILAKILANRFVIDRGWKEERAVALGTSVLRDNTERIFGM